MSREQVLGSVQRALRGRQAVPLPDLWRGRGEPAQWADFGTALSEALGTCVDPTPLSRLHEAIAGITGGGEHCSGTAAQLLGRPPLSLPPEKLDGLPWIVAQGFCAVASTGSVAVREQEVPHRLHLVLPENLLLLVAADALVPDLPDLYRRIAAGSLAGGYMTLISGPSKTADIELELVTGAHGPRALAVVPYLPG